MYFLIVNITDVECWLKYLIKYNIFVARENIAQILNGEEIIQYMKKIFVIVTKKWIVSLLTTKHLLNYNYNFKSTNLYDMELRKYLTPETIKAVNIWVNIVFCGNPASRINIYIIYEY